MRKTKEFYSIRVTHDAQIEFTVQIVNSKPEPKYRNHEHHCSNRTDALKALRWAGTTAYVHGTYRPDVAVNVVKELEAKGIRSIVCK